MARQSDGDGDRQLSIRGAVSLGVGAMVGAGIFALLGEAGAVAGAAVWLSFLLGGAVATLLGYAVAKLGARYPSSGGLVTFLTEGFGPGRITGIFSWLLYFAAIIVTSMVAVSFGNYAAALFVGNAGSDWANVFTTAAVILVAVINIVGASLIDRVQSIIVVVLLIVFGVFIVATMSQMETQLLSTSSYPPASDIVSSIALTFFAYLGFAVISYTGDDLPNPQRSLPRAMYIALGLTTALYVLISLGVFGTLTVDQVIEYGDTALAEAARPVFGDAGFALMAIVALLATISSVTANIYGAVGSTRALATGRQFPPIFGAAGRFGSTRGLTITVLVVLVLANTVDLSAIASVGSVIALVIFLLIAVAALRLRHETQSNAALILVAIAASLVVVVTFLVQTLQDEPETFIAMIGVLALAVVMDYGWTAIRGRRDAHAGSADSAGDGSQES